MGLFVNRLTPRHFIGVIVLILLVSAGLRFWGLPGIPPGPHYDEAANGILTAEIANGIEPERIVLAGFLQGGVVVLHAGLRYYKQLAGIIALSTYLPLSDSLEAEKSDANADTPILLAHGTADPVIPVDQAYYSQMLLEKQGYEVEWHEYKGMAHGVSEQEIFHLAEWLERRLV